MGYRTQLAAAMLLAGTALAVDCPKLIGLNGSNVLEYCDSNSVHHFMALSDSVGAPTPVATYAYSAPTPVPTSTPANVPTPQPTYAYTAPTPVPTVAQLSATYAPTSLAANTSRCDTLTVTGIVTGKIVQANPGVNVATGCVIASVWASATNTVSICWRNTFAATTACQTASSTWLFKQP